MSRLIDVMHLGHDRVIGAYEIDGLIVDPGPSTGLEALLAGLEDEPRGLLLTHIHLDHAGASGSLVRRFPSLRVYVHEVGAPHLVDPAKLTRSAARLYGDDMERLWGEVLPVPAENVVALSGGEYVDGFRVAYVPGHARHHVAYFHEDSGDAYVGDVAGVRIPPREFTLAPTPPPDIDVEAWLDSVDRIEARDPSAVVLTHFGRVEEVAEQLDAVRAALRFQADLARDSSEEEFVAALEREAEQHVDAATGQRLFDAGDPHHFYAGLKRYWSKVAT